MVLSKKRVKQKIDGVKQSASASKTQSEELSAASLTAYKRLSKREKRRQRKSSSAATNGSAQGEQGRCSLEGGKMNSEALRFTATQNEDLLDSSEKERNQNCFVKLLNMHENGEEPQEEDMKTEDLTSSSNKGKKRKSVKGLASREKGPENKKKKNSEKAKCEKIAEAEGDCKLNTTVGHDNIAAVKASASRENGPGKKRKKKCEKITEAEGDCEMNTTNIAEVKGSASRENAPEIKKKTCEKTKEAEGDNKTNTTNTQDSSLQRSEGQPQYDAKRVYVGGIPYYCSEDDIRSYFSECGTITDVECMTFGDTGKFRGIALLTFMTEAAAKRALGLDGADMGCRFLRIQPCKDRSEDTAGKQKHRDPPSKVEGCTRAYVGNLSWDITEDTLKATFKDCKINTIRLAVDESGKCRGYGHIDFVDDDSLELAMQLNQVAVLGRPIKIAYAVGSRTRRTVKAEP